MNHIAQPTVKEYDAWVAARKMRTIEAMKKHDKITGRMCREQNLSLRLLYDSGYILNPSTDTLEKNAL